MIPKRGNDSHKMNANDRSTFSISKQKWSRLLLQQTFPIWNWNRHEIIFTLKKVLAWLTFFLFNFTFYNDRANSIPPSISTNTKTYLFCGLHNRHRPHAVWFLANKNRLMLVVTAAKSKQDLLSIFGWRQNAKVRCLWVLRMEVFLLDGGEQQEQSKW